MLTEKEPLDDKQLAKLENAALKDKDGWIIILIRYTGMHPSVLVETRFKLREEVIDGQPVIVWDRPKKKGKAAYTAIKRSQNIRFDVNKSVETFQKRKRARSRQYIHALIKRIGEDAGIPGISPMTLRHSACVDMLERGIPEVTVRQLMNVSMKTMEHYAKRTKRGQVAVLERVGW